MLDANPNGLFLLRHAKEGETGIMGYKPTKASRRHTYQWGTMGMRFSHFKPFGATKILETRFNPDGSILFTVPSVRKPPQRKSSDCVKAPDAAQYFETGALLTILNDRREKTNGMEFSVDVDGYLEISIIHTFARPKT